MTDFERMITAKEAARMFGLSEADIRRGFSGGLRHIGQARLRTRASWVEDWICRESERHRDFGSTGDGASGLSETDRALSAQAHLNKIVQGLRKGSPNISGTNTNRSAGQTRV